MKPLNITKGKFFVDGYHITTGLRPTDETICDFNPATEYPTVFERNYEEAKANAELIVDAFNTANKCSLLPSELLKQRELLINFLNDTVDEDVDRDWLVERAATLLKELSAIQSIETNK